MAQQLGIQLEIQLEIIESNLLNKCFSEHFKVNDFDQIDCSLIISDRITYFETQKSSFSVFFLSGISDSRFNRGERFAGISNRLCWL